MEEAGRIDEAVSLYESLVAAQPTAANAWYRLSDIAARRLNLTESERCGRKAVELRPKSPLFRTNLATIYASLGRFETAEAEYRRVLRDAPEFANAYYNLSSVATFEKGDEMIGLIRSQLRNERIGGRDRSLLHFAAAKYFDQTGEPDRAFDHYRKGNELWGAKFSPRDFEDRVEATIRIFDADFFARRSGQGRDSQVPVFIVGMPRSGTSLTEQILASHPAVHGAGELPDITSIARAIPQAIRGAASGTSPDGQGFPACMPGVPARVVEGFADAYLDRLGRLAPGASRVVNKTMSNYLNLGLIAAMFPNARVVHCRRDPLDCCVSCYFQLFDGGFHDYACDLRHLGFVYRCHERLMEHWSDVLPIDIFELRYEDLVADQERLSRTLVAYCGLEWDPACAAFHRAERPVQTTSLRQVRQPIYKKAVGRWRRYEAQLAPLFEALGPLAAR